MSVMNRQMRFVRPSVKKGFGIDWMEEAQKRRRGKHREQEEGEENDLLEEAVVGVDGKQ